MVKKIVALIVAFVVSMSLAFLLRTEMKAKVTYVDKSFDKYGNIFYWAKTDHANEMQRISYPVSIGDTITVSESNAASVSFLIIALLIAAIMVHYIIKDADL